MATVRLDAQTKAELKRLAARRGQTRSEVVRDAINRLAAEDTEHLSADHRLGPFVGIVDSGGRQLSTDTGRKLRELLAAPLSLPEWQKSILRDRLADLDRNPEDEQPWDEIKEELWPRG
jgi:Arc/MetJ-type ribon-helix-helix transcriptional regulator